LNESGANANSANSANIQQNISEKFPEVPMKSVPVPPSTVSSTPVATTVAINPPKELDTDALITKDLTCSSLMSKLFQNSQEIEAVTDDLVVRSSEVLQETLVSSPVEGSKRSLLGHRDSAPSISSLPVSPRPKLSRSHSIPLETSRIGCDMSSVVEHECSTCKEKVSLHELEQHEVECATKNGSINVKKGRHCLSDIPGPEIFDHELRCDKMLKQCPHCLRRQKVSSKPQERILTAIYTRLFILGG
jgi:hypothetical protein